MPAAQRHAPELLDQLDPTVFEVFETLDTAWSDHRSCYPRPRFTATPLARVAAGFGDAELRSLGLWAQLRRYGGHGSSLFCEVLGATISAVARRRLAWQPDEVEVLWRLALAPHDTVYRGEFRLPLAATEQLDPGSRRPFADCLRQAAKAADDLYIWKSAERARLKHAIEELRASWEVRTPGEQVADLIGGADQLAARLRADLGDELTAAGVPALLRHWAGATSARPTATWTRRARELTAAAPGAVELIRTVLTWLLAHRERVVQRWTAYTGPEDTGRSTSMSGRKRSIWSRRPRSCSAA